MSNPKFSQLPNHAALTGTEILPAVQGGSAVQVSIADLLAVPAPTKAITGEIAAINVQNGTAYALQPTDKGAMIVCNNASPITVTVPQGFKINTVIYILQTGAGQVTLTAASGVSLSTSSSLKTRTANSVIALVYTANDTAVVVGDMA